jgi:hypothetical protein
MSKKNQINIEKEVMSQIKSGKISMKPKWYFVAGSLLMFGSIVVLSAIAIFLINLTIFALKPHYGPGAEMRVDMLINSFPWWAPILTITGIILAIWLLRKYDFSYRKNFPLIILSFILAVIIGAVFIDVLGFNDLFARRGPMRGFYRQFENQTENSGPKHKNRGNGFRYYQMNNQIK